MPHDTAAAEIALSRSEGGVSNTRLSNWSPSFAGLWAALSQREVGAKDGSYFVRGPVSVAGIRADDNIPMANVVVLDGDKRIDPQTSEIVTGAPDPELVHKALVRADIGHVLYSSHSHGGDKGNRFRVVIPAAIGAEHRALPACVDYLVALIQHDGPLLATVSENYRWAQPWYLPRIREPGAAFLCLAHETDNRLDVAGILRDWLVRQPQQADFGADPQDRPADGLIGRYVAEHGADAMMRMLEARGYGLAAFAWVNGHKALRFLFKGSESRQPGVVLFKSRAGKWRVVSFHGDHDPLAKRGDNGRPLAHDAFDLFRILEHGGREREARRAIDPRPVIRVLGGSLRRNTSQSIKALAAMDPPAVFQRGALLTRVAHLPEVEHVQGVEVPAGTAVLIPLDQTGMRLKLAEAAIFERTLKSGEAVEVDPPGDLANAVLGAAGEWDELAVLSGIAEAPIPRPDGSVHAKTGYDRASRLYCDGRAPELHLPDKPGRGEAVEAAKVLLQPFAEFPFLDRRLDESVVLAMLLTLAQRPLLALAPLFGVSASTPGAGKGLLIEVANLIVRGRSAATMPPPVGPNAEDEFRKKVTAILLQGVSSVLIDNWTATIGNDAINSLLTTASWTDRVLGASKNVTLPARVTWCATGNNLTVRGDMTRRTLLSVIDPKVERPERREFKVPDLAGLVWRHRGQLLNALYCILRAYRLAGEPERDGPVLGTFEPWSRAVAAPIRWLGWPDPVESQERLRADDPENQQLGLLLSAWHEVYGDTPVTAQTVTAQTVSAVMTGLGYGEPANDARLEELSEAVHDITDGRREPPAKTLGRYLKRYRGRVVGGLVLNREEGSTSGVARWRVSRSAPAPARQAG